MVILDLEPLEVISDKIRRVRKTLGISQKALAKLCGMSQGEIARIESNPKKLNPSYETLFEVIFALNNYTSSSNPKDSLSKKAEELMHRQIASIRPGDNVVRAIELMKRNDFSQLPVITREHRIVGTVYQKKLLEFSLDKKRDITQIKVEDIMEGSLPQVNKETTLAKIKPILENWDAVMIIENDKAIGIITIYDLFKII